MSWLKEHWEELGAVIVILILIISNTGDFIQGYRTNTLNYWDIASLIGTLLFMAFLSYTIKLEK